MLLPGTGHIKEAGLGAPFLTAPIYGDPLGSVFATDILPILAISVLTMVPFLVACYIPVRPRLALKTTCIAEFLDNERAPRIHRYGCTNNATLSVKEETWTGI
jgi:hypothetical protein